jgi:hypothetical protein
MIDGRACSLLEPVGLSPRTGKGSGLVAISLAIGGKARARRSGEDLEGDSPEGAGSPRRALKCGDVGALRHVA